MFCKANEFMYTEEGLEASNRLSEFVASWLESNKNMDSFQLITELHSVVGCESARFKMNMRLTNDGVISDEI